MNGTICLEKDEESLFGKAIQVPQISLQEHHGTSTPLFILAFLSTLIKKFKKKPDCTNNE